VRGSGPWWGCSEVQLSVSCGASGGACLAGGGTVSHPSALPSGGPVGSTVFSAGLSSARTMRRCWGESAAEGEEDEEGLAASVL